MTKAQVIATRDSYKALGAKSYRIVFSNDRYITSATQFLVWDDTREMIFNAGANNDHYTQAESPMSISVGFYEDILYIEGLFDMGKFEDAVDTLFADLISNNQKTILKEYAKNVNNQDIKPNRPALYYTETPRITPNEPSVMERTDGVERAETFPKT